MADMVPRPTPETLSIDGTPINVDDLQVQPTHNMVDTGSAYRQGSIVATYGAEIKFKTRDRLRLDLLGETTIRIVDGEADTEYQCVPLHISHHDDGPTYYTFTVITEPVTTPR